MVGAQVQPGTAADLEKPYRRFESVDQSQQTTDQRGRPAHLVGLWWLIKERRADSRRGRRRPARYRAIRLRYPSARRHWDTSGVAPVRGRREPTGCNPPSSLSGKARRPRIVFVSGQDRREHTVGFDVGGHLL